jgi:hypothetical protein
MSTNKEVIKRIENEIEHLKNKDFTLYFFTMDSKNTPNGLQVYTYELAYQMKELGYKVCMLYQLDNEYTEREIKKRQEKGTYNPMDNQTFCGVGDWMGEEYANLPHMNISKDGVWAVAPSDFLFIPDAFTSLMTQTYIHKIPCHRYILLTNFDYVTDSVPLGSQWANFGIRDCITTNETQAQMIKSVFPYVKTTILPPFIPEYFRPSVEPQKLIVNIISKKQSDVNKIMKMFYWKYPLYRFVTFKDLRGMSREHYAEQLKEGAITIWVDTETPFGYGALEAMRCNNIVIGKYPENLLEWMTDNEGNLKDNVIWFENFDMLSDILADVIGSWMQDEIPSEIYQAIKETNENLYTKEQWEKNVQELLNNIIENRIGELKSVMNNKNLEGEEE